MMISYQSGARIVGLSVVKSLKIVGILSLLIACGCREKAAAPLVLHEEGLQRGVVFEERGLRGFGTVSGKLWMGKEGGSVLEILCENPEYAAMTQAKYLSDLRSLPGVIEQSLSINGKTLSAWDVKGQGSILMVASGNHLYILSSPTALGLRDLLRSALSVTPSLESTQAQVEVPMWLNRWDKHGFIFYYRPWEYPPGKNAATYDITSEFQFARDNGHTGLIFWSSQMEVDDAADQNNDSWWDWAQAWAEYENLPAGIHLMTSNMQLGNWALDRWRHESSYKMPQFLGTVHAIANPFRGSIGMLSWGDTESRRALLGTQQEAVARFAKDKNIVTWCEPHGELAHAGHDIYLDYGPTADKTFREYLQTRYSDIAALNAAWKTQHATWEDIRVPEIASFAGWSDAAFDLTGQWRIFHPGTEAACDEWFAQTFDDSSWPVITAPGTDRNLFLPKEPAIYRRTFTLPAEWLQKHPDPWLYVWDLNIGAKKVVTAWVNGQKVAEDACTHGVPHWMAISLKDVVRAGENQVTLSLPLGYLGYRIYLSGEAPRHYPDLGEGQNALWADFFGWRQWTRVSSVKLGLEMIRGEDPNRQIAIMHPDDFVDSIKGVAEPMGATLHNTGYMSGFWSDFLPAISRGSRMPFSLEPGSPAANLQDFKKYLGLWHTEGVQGIDYFIHIGSVMWVPEIREYFQQSIRLIELFGKYHSPDADVAILHGANVPLSWRGPWVRKPNTYLETGYNRANALVGLLEHFSYDALTEGDFDRGHASRYRVIIDSNTTIMDPKLIEDIEQYVREGGTFVTFVHSGRHSPSVPNAWPISKLTGYEVIGMEQYSPEGNLTPDSFQALKPAPGQDIFTDAPWMKRANGLQLKRVADDAQDLVLWQNGTVAIGLRKLGQGQVIQVGAKWHGDKLPDRIGTLETAPAEVQATSAFVTTLLDHFQVRKVPGHLTEGRSPHLLLRHFVSNNGLYDVWSLWNRNEKEFAQGSLVIETSPVPSFAIDVRTGEELPVKEGVLSDLKFEPYETRIFLTPRSHLGAGAADWFALQRDWWKKDGIVGKKFPAPRSRNTLVLMEDWAWHPIAAEDRPEDWAVSSYDDSAWERLRLGIWNTPARRDVKHAMFRKSFTIPEGWDKGRRELWIRSWYSTTFVDKARVWLDGKLIQDWSGNGIDGIRLEEGFEPGTTHTIAMEIQGVGTLNGIRGNCWLTFRPTPEQTIDLAGEWIGTQDMLRDAATLTLPGPYDGRGFRRDVFVPKEAEGKNIVVFAESTGPLLGVIVNGTWLRRHHHLIGTTWDINVTPFIRFGEKNEIELATLSQPGQGEVKRIQIEIHRPEIYP